MIAPEIEQEWIEADARRRIDEAWRAKWRRDVALVWVVGAAFMASLGGLIACAHAPSPLVITGDALHGAALTFEATAAGLASANARGLLTGDQVRAWNAFLPKFKASFHLACELWRSARDAQDEATTAQAAAIIGALLAELAPFTALLMAQPDGGAS